MVVGSIESWEESTTLPYGRYLFSVFEAAPVLCRGGARYTATIRNCHRAPLHRSFLAPAGTRPGRERTGGGVGRGTRLIAGNARHPGTRPEQPAIKDTLNTYYGRAFRAPREAKSTLSNFLPRQATSDSSDPLCSMQRTVTSRCHRNLNALLEAKHNRIFTLTSSTHLTSVHLGASLWCSVTPLLLSAEGCLTSWRASLYFSS